MRFTVPRSIRRGWMRWSAQRCRASRYHEGERSDAARGDPGESVCHGFRYATRTLFNTLEARYYNQTWPGQNLAHDSAAIASAILDRIQYSGGMYQMFG